MKDNLLWLRVKKVMENLSYLVIGNILAQIISMVGLVFITRYLEVNDFGVYSTITSYISLFLIFTLPQINKVLIREGIKNEENLNDLLSSNIGLRLLLGAVSISFAIIGLIFVNYNVYTKILIAIFSITLLLNSVNGYYLIIYQVHEKMQYYSIVELANKIFYLLFTLLVVLLDLGLTALILFSILTLIISLCLNIRLSRKFVNIKMDFKIRFSWLIMKPVLIFSLLQFLGLLATSIDIFMISLLRPEEDVAIYSIAVKLTDPGFILRNLALIATFPMFIKIFNKGGHFEVKKLLIYGIIMGLIAVVGASVISIFSKPIIITIFSEDYSRSVPIFSILIFFLAFKFFELPFYNALQATNNELKLLYIYWIPPFLNIGLNYLFLIWFGLIGIAYSTIVVSVISLLLLLGLSLYLLRK